MLRSAAAVGSGAEFGAEISNEGAGVVVGLELGERGVADA